MAEDNLSINQINARLERMESLLLEICKHMPSYQEEIEILRYKEVIRQAALGDSKPLRKYFKNGGKAYRGIDI